MKLKNIVFLVAVFALMVPATSAAQNLRFTQDWVDNFDLFTRLDTANSNEVSVCTNSQVTHGYIVLRLKSYSSEVDAQEAVLSLLASIDPDPTRTFRCFRTTV